MVELYAKSWEEFFKEIYPTEVKWFGKIPGFGPGDSLEIYLPYRAKDEAKEKELKNRITRNIDEIIR